MIHEKECTCLYLLLLFKYMFLANHEANIILLLRIYFATLKAYNFKNLMHCLSFQCSKTKQKKLNKCKNWNKY